MQKDLKIGMILGLVLVTVAMIWLFAGPGISSNSRILNLQSNNETAPGPETSNSLIITDTVSEQTHESPTSNLQSQVSEIQNEEPEWKEFRTVEKIKTERFHIIREGETLSEISRLYYDSAQKWQKILDANRDVIEDVGRLRPGTKIIIPE